MVDARAQVALVAASSPPASPVTVILSTSSTRTMIELVGLGADTSTRIEEPLLGTTTPVERLIEVERKPPAGLHRRRTRSEPTYSSYTSAPALLRTCRTARLADSDCPEASASTSRTYTRPETPPAPPKSCTP